MNILILGGSSEASELVGLLATHPNITATLSLAGRTKNPVLPQINHRIGGFGGAIGLANYIKEQKITSLICATHPFAQKMPFNAQEAAQIANIPLLFLLRPQWKAQIADNWIEVDSHAEAIKHLSSVIRHPLSVFLTVGRLEISEYVTAPQHNYIIRSIDEITEKSLPNAIYITSRPPFSVENEREIMREHKIDYLITKNSGGSATQAKLIAAHELNIPVILINRPSRPIGLHVATANEAMAWIISQNNISV
ncbi:MAG: cobalt-precorrin-6A reductase [Rickettsiales bacterium]